MGVTGKLFLKPSEKAESIVMIRVAIESPESKAIERM
jgi:hypothetical protein